MNPKLILALLLCAFFFACRKDQGILVKPAAPAPQSNAPQPDPYDDVVVKMLPGNYVTTIRSFTPAGDQHHCPSGRELTPSDSSASQRVDVDGDGVDDFLIEANHHRTEYRFCSVYLFNVNIWCLAATDSVKVEAKDGLPRMVKKCDSLTVIDQKGIWYCNSTKDDLKYVSIVNTHQQSGLWWYNSNFNAYVQVKVGRKLGWIRLKGGYSDYITKMDGFIIRGTGINHGRDRSIVAGKR